MRAGELVATLDGIDLRWIRLAGLEVVRRIYVAVRGPDWSTLANDVSNLDVQVGIDCFLAQFDVRNRQGGRLSWHGRISGRAAGTIAYEFDGLSNADFKYARIGLCVHHPPAQTAGHAFTATTEDGAFTGVLSELVAPQQIVNGVTIGLFPPVTALRSHSFLMAR